MIRMFKDEGDALYGERIAYECKKHRGNKEGTTPKVIGQSHRAQSGILDKEAFCIIEKRFRLTPSIEARQGGGEEENK